MARKGSDCVEMIRFAILQGEAEFTTSSATSRGEKIAISRIARRDRFQIPFKE
jgi:hypothetical protein